VTLGLVRSFRDRFVGDEALVDIDVGDEICMVHFNRGAQRYQ